MRVLELAGSTTALLDDPLDLRLRGGGSDAEVIWRARVRDDDGRVWRAIAARAEELDAAWQPAKRPAAPQAAFGSLRPVSVEVRTEAGDGRAASRTVTRLLLGEGVRVRRWRGDLPASLVLPAGDPVATLLLDATGVELTDVLPAAALLGSRGVLTLVVPDGALIERAAERLVAVPGATAPVIRPAAAVPVPPGVPGATDAAAWDALLADLGATPRLSS